MGATTGITAPGERRWYLVALLASAACAADATDARVTQIDVTVRSDEHWSLTQFEIVAAGRSETVPRTPMPLGAREVMTLLVSDTRADEQLELAVWGRSAGRRVAYGATKVTPALAQITEASVMLHRIECKGECARIDRMPAPPPPAGEDCATKQDGDACEEPRSPAECFAASGECLDGACVHAYADGADCDDGDACTLDDTCASGACSGTPRVCPPAMAAECIGDVLRTHAAMGCDDEGECTYEETDTPCPNGCTEGACACTPGSWQVTTVDNNAVTTFTRAAIAVDANDNVHVLYGAHPGDELRYATKAIAAPATDWEPVWVATGAFNLSDLALAVDSNGGVHAVYDDTVTHHTWEPTLSPSGEWVTAAAPLAMSGYSPALAADAHGGLHLSYYDATLGNLDYRHKDAEEPWGNRIIADGGGVVGDYSSLAVDGEGGVHIVYSDLMNHDLEYTYKPRGGSFDPETLASAGEVGRHSAIAIDPDDGVHVAYYEPVAQDLIHAYRASDATTWVPNRIASEGNAGQFPAIGVDPAGNVHFAYSLGTLELHHAKLTPDGELTHMTIDSSGMGSPRTAMAIDANSGVHVVYYDEVLGDLMHGYLPACE